MAKEVPVVFFDRALNEVNATRIVTDDFESGCKATLHLIEQGCRNIAFLGVSSKLSISNDRMAGYRKAMEEEGLPVHETYCSASAGENYTIVRELLQRPDRPDGYWLPWKSSPRWCTRCARNCRWPCRRIVKLVCFSNLGIAAMLYPSLATVTQPAFEMGKAAAAALLKLLEKRTPTPQG